ncbi:MAG: NAD(P)/FAD-dependent oxidoreductase [Sphingomonadaceae bacterium]
MIYDVAIIGAGMAGASLAAEVAKTASVLMLEAEAIPGYHATGRSASFWHESYGGPGVLPLTSASGGWLSENGFLAPRGAVTLGRAEDGDVMAAFERSFAEKGLSFVALAGEALTSHIVGLRPEWSHGLGEPDCADIDVAALHAHYVKAAREAGAALMCNAVVTKLVFADGVWTIVTKAGEFRAASVVNAAGAWASEIAAMAGAMAITIAPFRRTIVQLRVDPLVSPTLPLVLDVNGKFYFKPGGGGRLWLSPHDETPCLAGDVAAEEIDIAIAIDQLQAVVDWRIEAVEHAWAGLRSFAPDRLPVYGYDPQMPRFFWCAGQGGFGIQTAPAAAKMAASLLLGTTPDAMVAHLDPRDYAPDRPALIAASLANWSARSLSGSPA